MSCQYCNHVVGQNYIGHGILLCYYCATPFDTEGLICEYKGKINVRHEYRIHPSQKCSECGSILHTIFNPCDKNGYDDLCVELFQIERNGISK